MLVNIKVQLRSYLVHIMRIDDGIHDFVQSVKDGNNLDWCTLGCQGTESDDVGEVDGNALEEFRLRVLTTLQLFADERGQHLCEQCVSLELFLLDVGCAFSNNHLQTASVALHQVYQVVHQLATDEKIMKYGFILHSFYKLNLCYIVNIYTERN